MDEIIRSDSEVLEALDDYQKVFEAGDKRALWSAIRHCAWYQAVMPPWMVDAIDANYQGIKDGHVRDFNEAFGGKPGDRRTRARRERLHTSSLKVTYAIHAAHLKGHAIDDSLFDDIGKQFGLGLSATRECYKAGRKLLPTLDWTAPKSGDAIAAGRVFPTRYRRRTGRSIL